MTSTDGTIVGTTKILDHGSPLDRWNLVILSEGYRSDQLDNFHLRALELTTRLVQTPPFDSHAEAINVYRVDVASTDAGADDPDRCGSGVRVKTYFDGRYCSDGVTHRALDVDEDLAQTVAFNELLETRAVLVTVNSPAWGGIGDAVHGVAVCSDHPHAFEIALHELGHAAFNLADEYCTDDPSHRRHPAVEPQEANVTINSNPGTIKWGSLITPVIPVPTTSNQDCNRCDPQPSPVVDGAVGAFEGGDEFACGVYRGEFQCIMRDPRFALCAVCQQQIGAVLSPYLPPLP
ncbi:M64 family metallopeptidase [Streptomyces sp. NPDC059101]|uniref:M64 family metallopeptidase n=1 Tax=Streptomyces sp. NPDC059101 TaxID=3346728 RepID=UPI0036BAF694